MSSRNARAQAIARSSSAGSSHSDSGWTMNGASRPISGDDAGSTAGTAPPQATMNSCEGPSGFSAERATSVSIRQVVDVLRGPVVAVAGRVVDRALEVRVGHDLEGVERRRPVGPQLAQDLLALGRVARPLSGHRDR